MMHKIKKLKMLSKENFKIISTYENKIDSLLTYLHRKEDDRLLFIIHQNIFSDILHVIQPKVDYVILS